MKLNDKVVIITGASSGIGKALAIEFASRGANLVLASRQYVALCELTESLINKYGIKAVAVQCDVAVEDDCSHLIKQAILTFNQIDILVNNAGISMRALFKDVDLNVLKTVMDVNFWGTVYGVKYFLPLLKREERSHIVDLSSVFGLIAPPGQPAYSASKFAVRGFTECLRHELAGTPVRVSCVHPGGIRTAIARRARIGAGVTRTGLEEKAARFEQLFRTSPEQAASRILRGVERSEPRILIGSDAYQIDILQRLRPGTYWKTLSRKLKNIRRN